MSLGCYLEFINRSFKSIIVNVNIREAKQWEKNSDSPDIVYNNRKIYDYDSSDMEMNELLTDCHGEFNFEIEVEDENGITKKQEVMPGSGVKFFNLKEGRQSNVRRSVYYFVDKGFFVRVSRGKKLRRIGYEHIDYGVEKGIFKVEVFSCSQKRLAVVADSHLCDDNKAECNDFVDKIVKIQNRPDFIVMCGDLTGNNYPAEKKIVEKDLIEELEARNFSVCEGLGNHDVRHFNFDGGMMNYIKNRDRSADGKLDGYYKDDKKKLHYHWEFHLCKDEYMVIVNCFMLNLVPGYGELGQVEEYNGKKKSKDAIKVEKDERNPFYSLEYLKTHLEGYAEANRGMKNCGTVRHVTLLFFHINYESESAGTDGLGPERWWPYSGRGAFGKVIDNNKMCRVIGTFFGHKHDLSTSIETLKTPETDWNYDLKGFKVASYLTNVTFLDLELVKEKGECVLKGSVNYLKTKDIDKKLSGCRKVDEFSFNFNDL